MMRKMVLVLAVSCGATGLSCTFLGSEAEVEEQVGQLAECRNGASEEEVEENILITEEYAGGVSADLLLSWYPVLFALDFAILWAQTLGAFPSSGPVGWTFEGGTYTYGSEAAAIEMRVYLSEDLAHGPAGTQVTEDILALDSYLVGAVIEANGDSVTITFDGPGPLVELLALGDAPTSPVTLDAEDRQRVVDSLSTLALETEFIAFGVTRSTTVGYHMLSPATTIASLGQEGPMPLELVEVGATRDALDQVLSTDRWEVERRGTRVRGFTTFTVNGGHFPFRGQIEFADVPGTVVTERELRCP